MISYSSICQAYLDPDRVHTILAPAIQRVCNLSPAQPVFFPATSPTRPVVEAVPGSYSHRPLPHCPAHHTPYATRRLHPPPRPRNQYHTRTNSFLLHVRHFSLPATPLLVVELCGGLATGLEALLRTGHLIAPYAWSDIDPDAHSGASNMIAHL